MNGAGPYGPINWAKATSILAVLLSASISMNVTLLFFNQGYRDDKKTIANAIEVLTKEAESVSTKQQIYELKQQQQEDHIENLDAKVEGIITQMERLKK